jgi:hypothetical protein
MTTVTREELDLAIATARREILAAVVAALQPGEDAPAVTPLTADWLRARLARLE